jgi:hypothetical protein
MLLTEFFIQENWATSNYITNEMAEEMSDVVTARGLIGHALGDPTLKHEYFEFLKHLRKHHGKDYSTRIHQTAAKLARVKDQD